MPLHLPSLLFFCTVLMVLTACTMSVFAWSQRVYRGYPRWLTAVWFAAAGIALMTLSETRPWLVLPAQLLLLQWPVLTLTGLRQFHARGPLAGSASNDGLALALGATVTVGAVLAGTNGSVRAAAFAFSAATLHGVAVFVIWNSSARRESAAMRMVCALMALSASALFAAGVLAIGRVGMSGHDALQASALVAAPAVLLMLALSLLLTHERTERELRESRRRLRFLANIDMLTQVPNRRHFGELAKRALERDAPGSAAVLMFDIDHFKRINDVLGHAAGDRALRLVARCVQETLRTQDVTGRHGGDEFVLLLPRTSVADAMTVAARIVARAQTLAEEQAIPRLSLSFGVVQTAGGESIDDTLRRADQALYEAKRQGRGRAVVASGDEDRPVFSESRRLGLTTL